MISDDEIREDPVAGCFYCEHASYLDGEELFVLCRLHNAEISFDSCCDMYIYDLLKRTPPRPMPLRGADLLEPIDF